MTSATPLKSILPKTRQKNKQTKIRREISTDMDTKNISNGILSRMYVCESVDVISIFISTYFYMSPKIRKNK